MTNMYFSECYPTVKDMQSPSWARTISADTIILYKCLFVNIHQKRTVRSIGDPANHLFLYIIIFPSVFFYHCSTPNGYKHRKMSSQQHLLLPVSVLSLLVQRRGNILFLRHVDICMGGHSWRNDLLTSLQYRVFKWLLCKWL